MNKGSKSYPNDHKNIIYKRFLCFHICSQSGGM